MGDAFRSEKLRTINGITFRAIKPLEIRLGPFNTRSFEFLLHRVGQIEISGSDTESVNVNCPLPIISMKMSISLILHDRGYQSLDVVK